MRKILPLLATICLISSLGLYAQVLAVSSAGAPKSTYTPPSSQLWRQKVHSEMPLLGHRNWILVVDSAYPLQTSPGVETIETGQSQLEVTQVLLDEIKVSAHVRPLFYMDAELPYLSELDAPGVSQYRSSVASLLRDASIQSLPHDRMITDVEDASKSFYILVLKTNMTIPYTSIFIRLDCKYWSAEAEKRLRDQIAAAGKH